MSESEQQTWRVALATGEVREVVVTHEAWPDAPDDAPWQYVARHGGDRADINTGFHDAVLWFASYFAWPAVEFVAPGEPTRAELIAERDRLQRACDEGLPREHIECPKCGKQHLEWFRHDAPGIDGRKRPHHTHRCYHCGHVWDSGRWSFGADVPKAADALATARREGAEAMRKAGGSAAMESVGDGAERAEERAMTEIRYEEPVLCYVEGGEAWFTTRDLRHQWGDDWNDTPYEHNAGDPYAWHPDDAKRGVASYKLLRVTYAVRGSCAPRDLGSYNSLFSVELINRGVVAWLWSRDFVIHAGTTLTEFTRVLREAGGHVGSPEVAP